MAVFRPVFTLKQAWVIFLGLGVLCHTAFAQTGPKDPMDVTGAVSSIEIRGLEEVDQSYIRSLLITEEQGILSPNLISTDIRSIFQLGFADDVRVDLEPTDSHQYKVIFLIKEKPRINKLILIGNSAVSDESITEKIREKRFSILNSEVIAQDIAAIVDVYKEKRIYNAKVTYSLEPVGPQKVNLVYTIVEHPEIFLTEINIKGSHYFSALQLQRLLVSAKIDCFSWVTSSGVLDENRINQDLQILYQTYANAGFIKLKVGKPRVRILEGKTESKAILDFYITEGDQYFVGKVDIQSAPNETLLVPKEVLLNQLQLKEGGIFNVSKMTQDKATLDNFYQDRGYAFNLVQLNNPIHDETKRVDILFQVMHADKVYINRVNISGNESTYDYVVRRELRLSDNELYRSSKVDESQRRLGQLGFFEVGTGINFERSQNDDKTLDYNLRLKETQTGSLNLSLTYSQLNGFGVAAQVAKRNLFGRGNSISLQVGVTNKDNYSGSLTYSQFYLFDTQLNGSSSASVNQYTQLDSSGNNAYKETDYRLSESIGQPIWLNWQHYFRIFIQTSKYTNITASGLDLLDQQTSTEERGLGYTVEYNSVDNPMISTNGVYYSIGFDRVGIIPGGTANYNRLSSRYQYFKSLSDDHLVVFMGQFRYTQLYQLDTNNPIPSSDRLSIGGITTIRGFDAGSVQGATSIADRSPNFDPVALKAQNPALYNYYALHAYGDRMAIVNFETLFPISRDQSFIRGVVFYDIGNVWSEPKEYQITGATLDYGYFKRSYGAGIRLVTPAGVIRFEYGIVINPKPLENNSKAELYIGSLF